jgi:hypothetical protein
MPSILTTTDHNRQIEGLTYIYPVISRRAGGLSVGTNLSPNNACNWRCVYCQVPNLERGASPNLDLNQLGLELNVFLDYVLKGSFFDDYGIEPSQRVIRDLALSGNGESTSCPQFAAAIQKIGEIASQWQLFPQTRFILITNGSLIHQTNVQEGLRLLNGFGGEIWFKLDSVTDWGKNLINNCAISQGRVKDNLLLASRLCHTKIQTCFLHYLDAWSKTEQDSYLTFMAMVKQETRIDEILLYSIARQSFQPEAAFLKKASLEELNQFAVRLEQLGFTVKVTP